MHGPERQRLLESGRPTVSPRPIHSTAGHAHSSITPVLLLLITPFLFVGCSKYGEVSPRTYEISSALYSVCNRKDTTRLDKVQELIESSVSSGDISASEQQWLTEIVESGRSGDWESAAQEARTIMEEQVQ